MNGAQSAATLATAGESAAAGIIGQRRPVAPPGPPRRPLCRYCLAPLENGEAFCSDECADAAWQIMPTVDGSVRET